MAVGIVGGDHGLGADCCQCLATFRSSLMVQQCSVLLLDARCREPRYLVLNRAKEGFLVFLPVSDWDSETLVTRLAAFGLILLSCVGLGQ